MGVDGSLRRFPWVLLARAARRAKPPYGAIDRAAAFYRKTQWHAPAELAAMQQRMFRALVAHCWDRVPYYRSIFNELGARRPEDVRLEQLPLLTKAALQEHREQLASTDLAQRRWYRNRSGGSTGEPVIVTQDRAYLIQSEAKKLIGFEWAGWRPGERLVKIWGSERDILRGGIGWNGAARAFLNNRITLNAFRLTPERMRMYLATIRRRGPAVLYGYAHAVDALAAFAEREGIAVPAQVSVVSTSGTLYPALRERMSRVFGCPVFDQYGSREVSCIASECEHHDGLHVNMETLIVEVLDRAGQPCPAGVEGEVVVTSLANFAMPLIRYRIGDRGVLGEGPCPCGRGLQVLAGVTGRSMDCFRRRNGTIIPAEYFIHFLGVVLNRGWIAKVQLVQHAYEDVELKLVRSRQPTEAELREALGALERVMGPTCRIRVQWAEDIPPSASGKYRYTICQLESPEAPLAMAGRSADTEERVATHG